MKRFRNVSGSAREVPSLGVWVDAGEETPELTDEQAAGFQLQGDTWHAVGDEHRAEQLDAIAEVEAAALLASVDGQALESIERPGPKASKAAHVDYAVAVVRALGGDQAAQDAAREHAESKGMTIAKLREELGLEGGES